MALADTTRERETRPAEISQQGEKLLVTAGDVAHTSEHRSGVHYRLDDRWKSSTRCARGRLLCSSAAR